MPSMDVVVFYWDYICLFDKDTWSLLVIFFYFILPQHHAGVSLQYVHNFEADC